MAETHPVQIDEHDDIPVLVLEPTILDLLTTSLSESFTTRSMH